MAVTDRFDYMVVYIVSSHNIFSSFNDCDMFVFCCQFLDILVALVCVGVGSPLVLVFIIELIL